MTLTALFLLGLLPVDGRTVESVILSTPTAAAEATPAPTITEPDKEIETIQVRVTTINRELTEIEQLMAEEKPGSPAVSDLKKRRKALRRERRALQRRVAPAAKPE